jgi:hypothetical protein
MSDKMKSMLWFALSCSLSFGSYLFLHIQQGWWRGYGPISAFMVAGVYAVICGIAFAISRQINRPLARGFIWGIAGILIFLFTIGGCGILPIGRVVTP